MELKEWKIIQLLKKIDTSELKKLVRFAKSPYHNSNKLIIQLLQKLLTYHPNFDHKKLTKEHLYHSIHPEGKAYHEGRMNLLMTNLVDLVQRFYMYQEFEEDQLLKKRLQGKAYNKRGFYKWYKKEVEGYLYELEKSPYREEDYFYNGYDIQQEFFFHIETPTDQSGAEILYKAMDDLDKFYITAKLSLAVEQITMSKRLKTKSEINFVDRISDFLENVEEKLPDVIEIYHNIYVLRKFGFSEERYSKAKNLFFDSIFKINERKEKIIYFNFINYIVALLNKGDKRYEREIFNLYKIGLNKGYILNNNIITSVTYSNISTIAMNLGEFEWCYKFIYSYDQYLPKMEVNDTKLMALAFWNYKKGILGDISNLLRTLELIREVKYSKKNILLYVRSRSLLIRTYYELMSFDFSYSTLLLDSIRNFEIQLKKDSYTSADVLNRHLASLQYVKLIYRLRTNTDISVQKLQSIQDELKSDSKVGIKKWLLEKVEELQLKLL